MSNKLNDDRETLENREELLKEEDQKAPLRDRIVTKLVEQLDDMNVGCKVVEMWHQLNADRQEWFDRQEEFLSDWDEFIDIDPQGIFESSSNLHIPVALWIAKSFHARFLQSMFAPDPELSVKARKATHIDLANEIEDFLKYSLTEWSNYRHGVEETIDQWIWSWITTGIGYIKWRWDTKYKRYVDVEENITPGLPRQVVDPSTGDIITIPSFIKDEVEVTKTEKTFEGPVCEFIPIEDIGVVGPDLLDINNADAVIHRQYMTASELWTLVDRKVFSEDAVEEVISSGEDTVSGSVGSDLKTERQVNSGQANLDKTYDLDRYEILECYMNVSLDKTGINSDIIVWVHADSKRILRATYLNRLNQSGERPIFPIVFHKRSGMNAHMPVGIVEMIHPLTKEIDAMHNMRIDYGLISTTPFGFYRASSSLDPKELKLEPGSLYPLDNPQSDIHFPNLGNRTSFGFQEEGALFTMLERLTNISDISLGIMTGQQGATRTATGSRILQQQLSVNLDVYLKRLNRGWKQALQFLMHMLQQRTPRGFEYRLDGDDGYDKFRMIQDPSELGGDYDIEVNPTSASTDKQIQMDNASQLVQLTQNPVDIQLGIVTPQNRYEALKNYLKILGVKEVSRFISAQFEDQVVLIPEEELKRLVTGFEVPVLPNADHEGFINLATQEIQSGLLESSQVLLINAQIEKHQQMIQALQQMQAQQANRNQMALNQQVAPTGNGGNNNE